MIINEKHVKLMEKIRSINDINDKENFIKSIVPSGSGFDTIYNVYEQKKNFKIVSSYHVMNENGYYDGWIDFTIYLWKNIPSNRNKDITIEITGKYSNYLADKYFAREYIKETIYTTIIERMNDND